MKKLPNDPDNEDFENTIPVKKYREALAKLYDEGDNSENLKLYKKAVKEVLGINSITV